MVAPELIATAWNNGAYHASGAGYGLKISAADRDRHMTREWGSIELVLPDPFGTVTVNIAKASFWNDTCRELIKKEIGAWLISERKGSWPRGNPPKITLTKCGPRAFEVILPRRG